MSKRVIVEVRTIVTLELVKTLGLYADGEKVVFMAKFSDPDDPDDSYSHRYKFDLKDYEREMQTLLKERSCELVDSGGNKLYIVAGRDGENVFFEVSPRTPHYSANKTSFPTNWTVAQIALPGTPVSCKAKPVVRNVYVGSQWG